MSNDLAAGTYVLAMDYPNTQTAANSTAAGNFTNTAYASDTNTSTTFIAPTSGRVMVNVGGELRDNSSTNYVRLSVSITDDRTGDEVVGPDAYSRGCSSIAALGDYGSYSSSFLVPGLEPGNAYTITLKYRVSGGSSADQDTVGIVVWPAT